MPLLTLTLDEQRAIAAPYARNQSVATYLRFLDDADTKTSEDCYFCEYSGHTLTATRQTMRDGYCHTTLMTLRIPATATKESSLRRRISLRRFHNKRWL